jgi:hypothetical protein
MPTEVREKLGDRSTVFPTVYISKKWFLGPGKRPSWVIKLARGFLWL